MKRLLLPLLLAASTFAQVTPSGGGGGVTSINNLKGKLTLAGTGGLTVTSAAGVITITSANGTIVTFYSGTGSPEGVVTAGVGSWYYETDTGHFWAKAYGTGNTGWVDAGTEATDFYSGAGSPENVVEAPVGALYLNTTNLHWFQKQSGTGSTGWVDIGASSSPSPSRRVTGYGGTVYVRPDRNLRANVGASYEVLPNGRLQLKAQRTFSTTIANCLNAGNDGSLPAGWSWNGTNNGAKDRFTACDTNVTNAGGLHLGLALSGDVWYGNAAAKGTLSKVVPMPSLMFAFVTRVKVNWSCASNDTGNSALAIGKWDCCTAQMRETGVFAILAGNNNYFGVGEGTGSNIQWQGPINAADGWWVQCFMTIRSAVCEYGTTNTNDPTAVSWTGARRQQNEELGNTYPYTYDTYASQLGFEPGIGNCSSFSGTRSADVLYWDDYAYPGSSEGMTANSTVAPNWSGQYGWAMPGPMSETAAQGWVTTNPAQTIITDFYLGSDTASISTTQLRAALAAVTNTRSRINASWGQDKATVTYALSRCKKSGCACDAVGTYASAASVTVGGSGPYLSGCVKINSIADSSWVQWGVGSTQGSVYLPDLAIPVTP